MMKPMMPQRLSVPATLAAVLMLSSGGAVAAAASTATATAATDSSTAASTDAAADQSADGVMQRVEVKATASRYDARRDDTASKIVVGSEDLQRYGDTSVLDAFKRVPGITVDGGQVKMRGLGSGYTQILINGERAPAGFTLDSLSPDMIEKIEILRAASAEYSTQSIAGTINIILKKTVRVAQRDLKVSVADSGQSFTPSTTLLLADRDDGFA